MIDCGVGVEREIEGDRVRGKYLKWKEKYDLRIERSASYCSSVHNSGKNNELVKNTIL